MRHSNVIPFMIPSLKLCRLKPESGVKSKVRVVYNRIEDTDSQRKRHFTPTMILNVVIT